MLLAVLTTAAVMPRSVAAQTPLPSPWVSQDIGAPALAGSASFNQGTFTISGSGQDIWGTSDQFRFVYQPVSGDVEIIARVDSISPIDPWSKSGVMIRGALSAGAPHAMALVSAGKGTAFQRRTQQDGPTTNTAGPAGTAPRWVRLVRVGTSVTASTSTDGGTWATIGSATIALGATAYVGMAVTSHIGGILASSAVSQVSVLPKSLPAPLKTQDIGAPAVPGSTAYTAGTFTITAAGVDIWDSSDQFRYVYQPVTGDVEVVARVASIVNTDVWAKAGIMVRETLSANSRNAMMMLTAANVYSFQRRIDQGGFTQSTTANGAVPGWIRLVRTGSQFQAFRSADGRSWTLFATDTVPMADAVYVGLAVTSHNASRTTTAVMDSFSVKATQGAPNQPPTVTLTQPVSGAGYAAPASIPLAATASDPENRLSRVEFFSNNTRIGTDTTAPYSMTWSSVAAGTYTLTATAFDADGGSATSQMVTVTVSAATAAPRSVVFVKSADHSTLVSAYRLDIFPNGANPATATRIAWSDLGKPTPAANGEITVDRATFFASLPQGTYVATVSAVGSAGESRGAAVTFTR